MTNWRTSRIENLQRDIESALRRISNWERALARPNINFEQEFEASHNIRRDTALVNRLTDRLSRLQEVA